MAEGQKVGLAVTATCLLWEWILRQPPQGLEGSLTFL